MPDSNSLEPIDRAHLIVGRFLAHWAFLESDLNDAIRKALDLDIVQGAVVTHNIPLRSKIHILRIMASLALSSETTEQERIDKVLIAIGYFARIHSNQVAHDTFGSDQSGRGVAFMSVRASGRLSFPQTVWSEARAGEIISEMVVFRNEIAALLPKLASLRPLSRLTRSLTETPTDEQALRGIGSLLAHLPPDIPDSDAGQPNQEREAETPPPDRV